MPCTHAIFNCHGLEIYFARLQHEATSTYRHRGCFNTLNTPSSKPASGFLVEDFIMGLSGTASEISQFRQGCSDFVASNERRVELLSQLEGWKSHLDDLHDTMRQTHGDTAPRTALLCAYVGREDPKTPGWEAIVTKRINALDLTARALYHVLALHLLVDLHSICLAATGSVVLGAHHPATLPSNRVATAWINSWAASSTGREAVRHSLCILTSFEEALNLNDSPPMDPTLHMALATATLVLWGWMCQVSPQYTCLNQPSVGANHTVLDCTFEARFNNWVTTGACLNARGASICWCGKANWKVRLLEALNKGKEVWEMHGEILAGLEGKW